MFRVAERTERLRVLIAMAPWIPDKEAAIDALPIEDVALLDDLEPDDLALANACIAIERQMRTDAMSAIERLGALITEGDGDLDDRVSALPQERFVLALSALHSAFWIY
jgi:hypothetical protein